MGSVYPRGNLLWIAWRDPRLPGGRGQAPTGLRVGNEAEARHALRIIERKVAAEILAGVQEAGPMTVSRYGRLLFGARVQAGVGIATIEKARFEKYIEPELGRLLLVEVRRHHVADFVRHLKTLRPALAPRTVRHVYGVLRLMLRQALDKELISTSPHVLEKNILPPKVDKVPGWRHRALLTVAEAELLISSELISELHRARYAGLICGGMRIGEEAARTWSDYDPTSEPLGRLFVSSSYNRKLDVVKGVKTDRPRVVPVHPTLARVLAAWKLSGWERTFGRPPRHDDLIWPSATLGHMRDTVVLREFRADCEKLGLRPRRIHDLRRTFISLARDEGASKDTLRQVTHQPEGDQMDDYTTLTWAALCREVAKLKVKLLDGRLLSLPVAANTGGGTVLQSQLQANKKKLQERGVLGVLASVENGQGGTRTLTDSSQRVTTDTTGRDVSQGSRGTNDTGAHGVIPERSNVADALEAARGRWVESGSKSELRRALYDLLHSLDTEGDR